MKIFSRKKILKLYLNGEITSNESKLNSTASSVQKLKSTLLEVKQTNKNNYKGILLKINSPGGTMPRPACFQRTSASAPMIFPLFISHLGCR